MMTSFFRIVLTVATLSMLTGCITNRSFGTGLDDTGADTTLKALLLGDDEHNFNDVDITVFERRMMLTGTVADQASLNALEAHARRVANVSEILNEVMVSEPTPFRQGTTDALIDRKLANAMIVDNGIFRNNYQLAVSNGTVYILGVAQSPEELSRVTGHARTIRSVSGVVSHVVYVGDRRRENG